MAKKKSRWNMFQKIRPEDTVRNRDVYNEQQIERSDFEEKETMTSRNILNIAICVIVFLFLWFIISFIQMALSGRGEIEMSEDPAAVWIHVDEHYEGIEDPSDKMSVDEYETLKHMYENSASMEPLEEPKEPTKIDTSEYMYKRGGYAIPDRIEETWMSEEEFNAIEENYQREMEEYEQKLAEYKAWKKSTIDPDTVYRKIPSHYRKRVELRTKKAEDNAIHEDEYQALVDEWNEKLSKNKISADMQDIPVLPLNPADYWTSDSEGKRIEYIEQTDEEGNTLVDEYGDPIVETEETTGPLTYRNNMTGEVISYMDYDEMVNKYNADIVTFKEKYANHRNLYHDGDVDGTRKTFSLAPNFPKFLISALISGILFSVLYIILKRNLAAANIDKDTAEINSYKNDQHVAFPEEIQQKYDWFPDVGCRSAVAVSSMISHMALANKGLKKIEFAKRAEEDIKAEDDSIEYYEGEILLDDDGNPITSMVPIIDEKFMEALFDASGNPKNDRKSSIDFRKRYDATLIPYNPDGSNRDKLGKYETVADLINDDWELPIYEPQRPGGAYIVDTAPVNTMVLAITRAGKGQTVIEPTIDMWTREKRLNNMVVNDPKGELLVKNYVRCTVRGMQVVQFNLINAMKTDIYNPLAMAADAAREGDNTKCAMYVENIAEVFFPLDGGEDPVWPNAANNAFKRAAYGLIDYYLEEEKAMRRMAERTRIDDKVLEQRIDSMWGKVTLYNCYQLFVQLSSKKMKNPATQFTADAKAGKYNDLPDEVYRAELAKVKQKSKLWEDKPEADLLTLYFNATDALPKNSMRTLVSNANNALKSMGGAEKMMASVYGIAITAMSFFADPTISTLTSGTPNQNVDLASISFPRRMGVRFHPDFLQKYHFVGLQCIWNAYEDPEFKKCLGKDFYHEDMVTREGWARYYFDGKFAKEKGYVKLEVKNPSTDILVRTFYFEFRKSYMTSLDGRVYMKDPILEERIVKNGLMSELRPFRKKDGTIVYRRAKTTFKQKKILDIENKGDKVEVKTNAIISTMCKYAEKPKAVFLVTPPHLMKYAKLILILLKQLVDFNFDKSYMTKSNQKPLYKTRFMLDELGNLQSEGHGIAGFETMLSIGLGQEQQFTLILQTLQQLRDVYGESVDKIVQGNAQPLDSKIMTPYGFVLMGDIRIGDEVITPTGNTAMVSGVYPRGVRPVYIVRRADGSSCRACNEHLWKVQLSDEDYERWLTLND